MIVEHLRFILLKVGEKIKQNRLLFLLMMIEWELKWNVDVGYIIDDKCILGGTKEDEGIRH
jgi:hypothetical protein